MVVVLQNVDVYRFFCIAMKHYNFEKLNSFSNKKGEQTTRFCLKNLEQSHGITIANPLRRILLTELEGTAITAFRIKGLSHEYGILAGMREDILELLLNFKQVKFKGILEEPFYVKLNITGPRLITAKDIPLMKGLNVINSTQYIATISEQCNFQLELKIESGKGYRLLTDDIERQSGNFLNIDAAFTPVKNVTYQLIDKVSFTEKIVEDLELEITTDGSLTPNEALFRSAQILQNLFGSLTVYEPKVSKSIEIDKSVEISIEELQLSMRAYNCLFNAKIRTIEQLSKQSIKELRQIKNFGQKSANEVVQKLKDKFGICLN